MAEEEQTTMTETTEVVITNENNTIETPVEPTTEPEVKTSRRRAKKAVEKEQVPTNNEEVIIEVETPNTELEDLKKQLEEMRLEKSKLEEERKVLNETVIKLQEEVKITPQKLGKAIREMGVEPVSTSRDNPQGMTIETYNSMTDSQRREWQRSNRADYLKLMHTVKLNSF